jgi:hypothetical protein
MNFNSSIPASVAIRLKLIKRKLNIFEDVKWYLKGYPMPATKRAKLNVLKRYSFPRANWIETGTYLGETTLKLSRIANEVISLEPQKPLYEFTSSRFKKIANIQIIFGTSEAEFENVTKNTLDPVCFWLDGHSSGDITFQGDSSTPVSHELRIIQKYLPTWKNVTIYVDDVREFTDSEAPDNSGYPSINYLINWASECQLGWRIEHDIFIASTLIK